MMGKAYRTRILLILFAIAILQLACGQGPKGEETSSPVTTYDGFTKPQRVEIVGYDDHAMEPFLSRDGETLFFNNSNTPGVDTNLHYARRMDDVTFEYMGEVAGVNSDVLDAVASMDVDGDLYFVSLLEYEDRLMTIFRGQFTDGEVSDVAPVAGLSEEKLWWVNFDVEISADGETVYFVDGRFRRNENVPREANFVMAVRQGDEFVRAEKSDEIFAQINTDELEYAAAISTDELEFFFTRLERDLSSPPVIFRTVRESKNGAFGPPQQISAITGFVEAATLSPDGRSLYYHKKVNDRFVIYRVIR